MPRQKETYYLLMETEEGKVKGWKMQSKVEAKKMAEWNIRRFNYKFIDIRRMAKNESNA